MKTKIYVVFGTTGEYSDRWEWPVDAWRTKEAAQARVDGLKARMAEFGGSEIGRFTERWDALCTEMRKTDPDFSCDYTGTEYRVVEIPLRRA